MLPIVLHDNCADLVDDSLAIISETRRQQDNGNGNEIALANKSESM
jgi:hypothetical protein